MNPLFFKTLWRGALIATASISLYLAGVFLIYIDPMNAVPKTFDVIFFIAFPLGAMIFYRFKVNNGLMMFQEGLVMASLINFSLLIGVIAVITIFCTTQPEIIDAYIADRLEDLQKNKTKWLQRLQVEGSPQQTQENYNIYLQSIKSTNLQTLLLQETGLKLIITFFVAIVGATAFRNSKLSAPEKN